jgi:hypothetical protein
MKWTWKFLKRLIFGRRKFPWWFHEFIRGSFKVAVGQDITKKGDLEVIMRFSSRERFGEWKQVGQFRYLDSQQLKQLLGDVDSYVRSLVVGS